MKVGRENMNDIIIQNHQSALSLNPFKGPRAVNPSERRIVAYFSEWGIYERNFQISDVHFDKITHFNYAFIDIDLQTSEVHPFDRNAANINLPQIREAAINHPHVIMMATVGGWTRSGGFRNAASSSENRQRFADSCVNFIREWEFDGLNIDWEFPTVKRERDINNPNDQGTPHADDSEAETFVLLLKTLREALDRAGHQDGRYYTLTAAASISPTIINRVRPDTYAQYLDFLNVMSYDIHGPFEPVTGHQSALYHNPFEPYHDIIDPNTPWEQLNTDAAMRHFESFGIHPNKLVLGVPFYTRGWGSVSSVFPINNVLYNEKSVTLPGLFAVAPVNSVKGTWDTIRGAGTNSFDYAEESLIGQGGFTKYRDPWARVPYIYHKELREMYTYDDEASIKEKAEYVNSNNFGGINVWDLSGNRDGRLLDIMVDVMLGGAFGSLNTCEEDHEFVTATAPASGTLILRVRPKVYGFTPSFTVAGEIYNIGFGEQEEISLPLGTYDVVFNGHADSQNNYIALILPNPVVITADETTVIDIDVTSVMQGNGCTSVSSGCFDVSVDVKEDVVHYLNVKIANNSNETIDNWALGFEFNNPIHNVAPDVNLSQTGNNYVVSSSIHQRNLMPYAMVEFAIFFRKNVDDDLRNITMNGSPICVDALPPILSQNGFINVTVRGSEDFIFDTEMFINGDSHIIPIGQSKLIELAAGSYSVSAMHYEDDNFIYTPFISNETPSVLNSLTTNVDIEYKRTDRV